MTYVSWNKFYRDIQKMIMTQNLLPDCIHQTCQSGSTRGRSRFCTTLRVFVRILVLIKDHKMMENWNQNWTWNNRNRARTNVLTVPRVPPPAPLMCTQHRNANIFHFQTRKFLIIKQTPDVSQTWAFPLGFLMTKSETSQFPDWGTGGNLRLPT